MVDWQDGSRPVWSLSAAPSPRTCPPALSAPTQPAADQPKALRPDNSNSAWYSVTGDTEFGTTS